MAKYLIVPSMVLALASCTDSDGAKNALDNQGYTNIQTTGYSFFGCSKDDLFRTSFTAINQNGKTVSGVVCSGFFKGSTIRFD